MINDFPSGLLSGLNDLAVIYASDYRFCCEESLPNIAPYPRCLAPQHYLSSCDDMLQSEVYKLNFWLVTVLSCTANLVCFVSHTVEGFIRMPYAGSVAVFMVSLQCADMCMGIYATVITAAQEKFSSVYIRHEYRWKGSVPCKVTGFLSLVSSEVSILLTCLLTLDHAIRVWFTLSTYRFREKSAGVACGVTWLLGILMAAMPLLPRLSVWGCYGQTAV